LRCKKCQKKVDFFGVLRSHDEGRFVMWDDYAALQAENDRLRKAGDELARVAIPSYILDVKTKAIEAWLAAKGERP
jgi:hypothetical protein